MPPIFGSCGPGGGELDVGVVVDLTDDLLRVPREPHLTCRITSSKQPGQPFAAVDAQTLGGHREPSAGPVERIVLAAAMTNEVVLRPSPAFVERGVRQPHDMERVSDLDR